MTGWRRQLAEPARWWIAHAPRRWRVAARPWTDLASGGWREAGEAAGGAEALPAPPQGVDDLCYLPPCAAELAAERDRLAAAIVAAGAPVRIQLLPGEVATGDGVWPVYDLLPALLDSDLAALDALPSGATVVWPLVSGISDGDEVVAGGCRRLAEAGVACVQGVPLELDAGTSRRLAEERGEEVFDALFHGAPPSERGLARAAAAAGMAVLTPRPPSGGRPRRRRNRRAAAELALAGDLWLRLGRPVAAGQAMLRAARAAEDCEIDLAGVAREGNLGVVEWLDGRSITVLEDAVAGRRSTLVEELLAAYVASGG